MKKKVLATILCLALAVTTFTACGSKEPAPAPEAAATEDAAAPAEEEKSVAEAQGATGKTDLADTSFDTSYQPKKTEYKIYCTYKLVHNWYDAIEAGVKQAVVDMGAKGVKVDYEWYAPIEPDAIDQVNSIETAAGAGWDIIAVDVTQADTTTKAINDAVDKGVKVCMFAGSDLPESKRAFFVGNTDNYGDGAALAKAVAEKMGGKGEIAFLSGTMGAPSHEQRLEAFYDVMKEYPDIKVVDDQRDNDLVEKAIQITESWLQAYPELGGILANNMSNPIGAAQAVADAGKSGKIVIGGMDHDLRTFNFLKDGTIYVAQVQNCFDMGYKMVYNAIKIVDGETVEEVTSVGSTSVYQDQADKYINLLY